MISLPFPAAMTRDSTIEMDTEIITQILKTICHTEAPLVETTSALNSFASSFPGKSATVMVERLAGVFCWTAQNLSAKTYQGYL